jgi:hypothetical protein
MDCSFSRGLRVISGVVLFFFLWTFELSGIAYAIKNDQQATIKQSSKTTPEKKIGKDIEDIDNILKDTTTDTETKKGKLKTKKTDLEADDIEIKKTFSENEKIIKEKGLPQEILDRHRNFVKKYDDNYSELKANLDAIDKAKTAAATAAAIDKAKAHLAKVKAPSKHKPLDPNNLPVKSPEEKQVILEEWKAPEKPAFLLKQADIQTFKPILVAANGSLKGILTKDTQYFAENYMQLALVTPENRVPASDADLAESSEIQFTPAIKAKAADLGHNPHKIYEWVRNNIDYVPTYGSIQGADMCLQTKQCNDTDTASLLIGLLRTSGVHARYAYGVIERPIDKVMNWVGGFTDPMAALNFIASAGIPVKGLTEGGQIKYVQMEHVWVEAWIDYIPSRGAVHKAGKGDTWIPIDGSYKQFNYTPGIDIKSAVPFDAQTFVDQIKSSATINESEGYVTNVNSSLVQQTMTDYQSTVQNYISQNYPNATVGDVLGKKGIIKQEFPYLLGTMIRRTISKTWVQPTLPDNLRHKVSFSVTSDNIYYDSTPLNVAKFLAEVAGKKITLSYAPATSADEAVINSYLPKPHADGTPIQPSELLTSLPAYLIQLKPELLIDGALVATGGAIGMGEIENFTISITQPNLSGQVVHNKVTVGEYNAVALAVTKTSVDQLTAAKTKLDAMVTKLQSYDFTSLTKDDLIGNLLYTTALNYFADLDAIDSVTAISMGVLSIRLPSVGRFFNALTVDYVFGAPVQALTNGLSMDIGLIRKLVRTADGTKDKQIQFMLSSGANSSALEHTVPARMFSTLTTQAQGISAAKALQIANDQGIPIYTLNQANMNSILPHLQLSPDVIADVQNAVTAGKIVTVAKTNISFNGWVGCGYVIIDPNTGAGAYLIAGGLNGAAIRGYLEIIAINLYLLPSGRGFDEIGQTVPALLEELKALCQSYIELMQYGFDYLTCVRNFLLTTPSGDFHYTLFLSTLAGTGDVLIAANWLLTEASLATAMQVASGIGALLAGALIVSGILYSAGERCRATLN